MPVSLNNSKDIVANSISIIKGNETIDLLQSIEAAQNLSLVPTTLNALLDAKVDDTEMANYSTKATTYTKTEVDMKFNDIINGAPSALNTLKELSDALGADASFSTTVLNQIGDKAPKANPTFTGTVTIPTMTFNGSNLQTTLDGKAPKASPTFTGTATIPLITSNTISPPTSASLHLGGDTIADGDIAVASGFTLSADTIGKTTFGNANLTIIDPTKILGDLTIGAAAANRTLTVYGNTTMNGNATTPTMNVNTIDTIADMTIPFATSYPDLQMSRSVNIGTFADQQCGFLKNLKVYGNTTVNGNTTVVGTLSTIGVTTLGDDLNIGTTEAQAQGQNTDLNVYGAATVLGNVTIGTPAAQRPLTVNGNISAVGTMASGGDMSVSGSRLNVVTNITNTQSDGFASLYFNTPAGVGQFWCGQNEGLNFGTNTAHPIRFTANRFAAGNLNSIEIQGTGTRNVVVNAPLLYKPYVSLLVTTTSGVVSVTNFGYCTLTAASVTRVGTGSKAYSITLPIAHPYGSNFAVFATAQTGSSSTWDGTNDFIVTAKVETGGTAISVWCRRPGVSGATASGFTDGSFYVHSIP